MDVSGVEPGDSDPETDLATGVVAETGMHMAVGSNINEWLHSENRKICRGEAACLRFFSAESGVSSGEKMKDSVYF